MEHIHAMSNVWAKGRMTLDLFLVFLHSLDSIQHLEQYRFGKEFLNWIKFYQISPLLSWILPPFFIFVHKKFLKSRIFRPSGRLRRFFFQVYGCPFWNIFLRKCRKSVRNREINECRKMVKTRKAKYMKSGKEHTNNYIFGGRREWRRPSTINDWICRLK